MIIPVEVQRPNQPQTRRFVGRASDELSPVEVAKRVGVPDDCLIDGRILTRKGERCWSLVANVRFGEPS